MESCTSPVNRLGSLLIGSIVPNRAGPNELGQIQCWRIKGVNNATSRVRGAFVRMAAAGDEMCVFFLGPINVSLSFGAFNARRATVLKHWPLK